MRFLVARQAATFIPGVASLAALGHASDPHDERHLWITAVLCVLLSATGACVQEWRLIQHFGSRLHRPLGLRVR